MAKENRKFESATPAFGALTRPAGRTEAASTPTQASKDTGPNREAQILTAKQTVLRLIEFFKT